MNIRSEAFDPNRPIPKRFTEDGEDLSPPLAWSGVPQGARALALICDDPDAPRPQPWVHWVIYDLPADVGGLREGVSDAPTLPRPASARQGKNSWGTIGYRGPAPPKGHGTHHYHFRLYALNEATGLEPGATKEQLLSAMKEHVVAEAELIGTYER